MHVKLADFQVLAQLFHVDICVDVRIDVVHNVVGDLYSFLKGCFFHENNCSKYFIFLLQKQTIYLARIDSFIGIKCEEFIFFRL